MTLPPLLTPTPVTGDDSPQRNIVVFIILGVATVAAVVLGLWKG